MSYKRIVWIKLFLSLLTEDDRFLYQLNESQQLLYLKLLLLAGMTNNKITKNYRFICHRINYHHEEACFLSDINRIKEVFPRFKESEFYYFDNFKSLHNYYEEETLGSSKGVPKELPSISLDKKRIDKDKEEEKKIPKPSFLESLKTNTAYKHINLDIELSKMDAWLTLPKNKHRKKTPQFVLNWLNKIEAPLITASVKRYIPPESPIPEPCDPKVATENLKKMRELIGGIK